MSSTYMKKVIVGISGGVDSSVTAWLLKKKGYQVEGVFIKSWENDDHKKFCASALDLLDARSVCNDLKIPLHTINFSKEYWDNVFQVFLKECNIGHTPNPDILCNKEIKFKCFMEFAFEDLGGDFIATGHYARRVDNDDNTYLMKGFDKNKDQSYFLYTLSYKQIKKCLFPLGIFTKLQVRNIAKKLNLITANKKDSTGICFIGKRKFKDFLSHYIPTQPGYIYDIHGKKIGIHQGVQFYTLGQRKGLNIGGIQKGNGKPWYIVNKDLINNILIVAQGNNNPYLMSNEFVTKKVHWVTRCTLKSNISCFVKIRYRQPDIPCNIYPISHNNVRVILNAPTTAVTPGQSAVFYLKERCLGGGVISENISCNNIF